MPTGSQVRGMLLEEALLHLLRVSGYRPVEDAQASRDPTLDLGGSGIEVKGRGSKHQIDAIADFRVAHPFSHPQRVLVEAKCYLSNNGVDLPFVRNAVGVLKDVSERWVTMGLQQLPVVKRYHYQYALFSASGYTHVAQAYAFAQDVFLISLAHSAFIQPLLQAIRAVDDDTVQAVFFDDSRPSDYKIKDLRAEVRLRLQRLPWPRQGGLFEASVNANVFARFIEATHELDGAVLATLGGQFPILLTPGPNIKLEALQAVKQVQLNWDENSWFVEAGEQRLFSFDLPTELLAIYAVEGELSLSRTFDLKSTYLNEIQAFVTSDGSLNVLTLELDMSWLDHVHQRLRRTTGTP